MISKKVLLTLGEKSCSYFNLFKFCHQLVNYCYLKFVLCNIIFVRSSCELLHLELEILEYKNLKTLLIFKKLTLT